MPMTEDHSVFFDADEFGTECTVDGVPAVGVFERGYLDVDGVATYTAHMTLSRAAVPAAGQDSVLVIAPPDINAGTYRVRVPQRDGTGVVVLPLELQ